MPANLPPAPAEPLPSQQEPRCQIDRGPNWLFVRVPASKAPAGATPAIAEAWAKRWTERLWEICEQHLIYRLVVEMDGETMPGDSMEKRLEELRARLAEHGGALRVCGMSADSERRLHDSHCGIRNHHSRREAVLSSDAHESVLLPR